MYSLPRRLLIVDVDGGREVGVWVLAVNTASRVWER